MRMLLKLSIILKEKSGPPSFVDKQVKLFLENKINEKSDTVNVIKNVAKYYKLPYISHISTFFKRNVNRFCKYYFKSLNIKIVLTPFKVADMLNLKDPIPKSLKFFAVYKFVSPGCNICYIGETTRHLLTKIKEDLKTDKKFQIFTQLVNNET